jgi:hypothetical protein
VYARDVPKDNPLQGKKAGIRGQKRQLRIPAETFKTFRSRETHDVDSEDMQRSAEGSKEERSTDSARSENQHLERVSVLCRKTEWCAELVMQLVDVLITHERDCASV